MARPNFLRILAASSVIFSAGSAFAQKAVQVQRLDITVPSVVSRSMKLGHTDPSTVLHVGISIPLADEAGLQRFVDSVSNPKSPTYRQFITPEQIGSRFGMPTSAVNSVKSFLTANGFKVKLVAKSRMAILADATVAQVEAAFQTEIDDYATLSPNEHGNPLFHSFSQPLNAPVGVAKFINCVTGLENFTKPKPAGTYLKPAQRQVLYDTAPILAQGRYGQGRTVAISNFDGFSLSSVPTYLSTYGLPTPAAGAGSNISVVTINGGAQFGQEQGEGDLDIQCVLGVAPLCNLIIYDGGQGDLFDTLITEENDNLADVVTESYGWGIDTSWLPEVHDFHLAMSAQGMTYMCASGDDGPTDLQPSQTFYPDIDPEVLTVGGTTTTFTSSGARITEVGWSGSGGGWSTTATPFNVLPSYQVGTGVPTNIPFRLVPDVALDADPNTGYSIIVNGTLYIFGGTSAASPTFAASLAVSEQQLISSGGLAPSPSGKRRFGRIQDLIYSMNGNPSVFYDITSSPSTGTLPNGASAVAGPGWDFVTGWGAMDFNAFVNYVLQTPQVTSVSATPNLLIGGATVKISVNLSGSAPTGGATVQLTSSDPVALPLPSTVVVPAGAKSASVTVTTGAVSDVDDVVVTAKLPKGSATTVVSVTQPTVSKIAFTASSVVGGSSTAFNGTVTLKVASPNPVTVTLTSSAPAAASVPSIVTVPANATSVTFPISTTSVAAATSVTATAISGGATLAGKFTVNPPTASLVSLAATTVYGGAAFNTTGTVTLNAPAPVGGLTVSLASSATAATVSPTSVTVAAGKTTATFTVSPKPVSIATTVTISATTGATTAKTTIQVIPPILTTATLSTTSAVGGVTVPVLTVTLNAAAGPTGAVVALSSSATAAATMPTSVTVPANATSTTVNVTTLPVSTNTAVTLTATLTAKATATLTVDAAVLKTFTVSASTVKGGTSVTGTLTLASKAGPSGLVVALKSSSASATVLASVTVPAGATTVNFTIATKTVTANTTATITATTGTVALPQTITITP